MELKKEALNYHTGSRPGKLEVNSTKPCRTQRDLSLAYTPGVAEPCREIAHDPTEVFKYTAKGNLVAVVTNGTAVLGLGRIGPLAGKPVMEGKAVLFKRFADIDVFDLEVNSTDPDEVIRVVQLLEPTFGGINLEDIAAPDCFYIEEKLAESMEIPVFHDDQHGTAIISLAAVMNGLELVKKDFRSVRIVISGAGAAGIAISRLMVAAGATKDQIVLCDTVGVVHKGRDRKMNRYKEEFATDRPERTLAEAMKGADIFLGVSAAGIVTPDMVASMARSPLVLAMANPDPEITYPEARKARPDVIMATGRSDYPNQVNNVLGFPFIFRGALDVQARSINMEMKLAASRALAELAKQTVPESVSKAYGDVHLQFGPEYIIPKPFDRRVLVWEASAVAEAAMRTGVARKMLDLDEYRELLESRLGLTRETMRLIIHRARRNPRSVVLPEGTHPKILHAAAEIVEERVARPILLGRRDSVLAAAAAADVSLEGITLVDPSESPQREAYIEELYRLRQRKGVTRAEAARLVDDTNVFGALMVRLGDADALVSGVTQHYPDTIRPMLQIVGKRPDVSTVVGVFLLTFRNRCFFIADATVNVAPDAECLAEIAIQTAATARRFKIEPKVAMLSFSNFGSVRHDLADLVREATRLVRRIEPSLVVDGEMQADTAIEPEMAATHFPFSAIKGDANVLVFPDLTSGNIAYKLLHRLGGAEVVGPILVGMNRPVHVLHQSNQVSDIVNLAALAVTEAQDGVKPVKETEVRVAEPAARP